MGYCSCLHCLRKFEKLHNFCLSPYLEFCKNAIFIYYKLVRFLSAHMGE